MVMEAITVRYAGEDAGALSFDTATGFGNFEFESKFQNKNIELSPLMMPLSEAKQGRIFNFTDLAPQTFKGLPGMIADSLPDDFGNAVLNAWIARQGKSVKDITPLERLQYTGLRGMGALEFVPSKRAQGLSKSTIVVLDELVRMAQEVVNTRNDFAQALRTDHADDTSAMRELLQVGMSAGGARPKAVLAFDKDFSTVRSGQVDAPEGFTHYLMKFDGVSAHQADGETFGDPLGYGVMEYVYYLMATKAGIEMAHSMLLDEGKRRHFLSQRFDRQGNKKVHVQTLNAIAHVDYKIQGQYSYYELFSVARRLNLSRKEATQLLRRMIFNIVARNHDDHSKNFSFMMNDSGNWSLAPAYDMAYSYKPGNFWVNSHWMTLQGKRENFTREDILSINNTLNFGDKYVNTLIDEVVESVSMWQTLARDHEVPKSLTQEIAKNLRLDI